MSGPLWDKEWNKLGTLETKAFPIRDGYHAPPQLCHALREFHGKKRENQRNDSAIKVRNAPPRSVNPSNIRGYKGHFHVPAGVS